MKKVKQTESIAGLKVDKGNMSTYSSGDLEHDRRHVEDADVSSGIYLLFTDLSKDIQSSYDKLLNRLDNLGEKNLRAKLRN